MGKIVLSNNMEWMRSLHSCFQESFSTSFLKDEGIFHVHSYRKICTQEDNYFQDGNNYVVVVGTVFYKGMCGKDSLEQLLKDSQTKDTSALRKEMIGSYAVVLKVEDTIRIFLDETHTYHLYYYLDGKNFVLTNTYWHIANVVGLGIDEAPLIEKGVRNGILSNRTPIDKVFKLGAREMIEINLKTQEIGIKEVKLNDYHRDYSTLDEAVGDVAKSIEKIATIRSHNIKNCMHFLTGGIDSRVEAAIHLWAGDKLTFAYWKGEDALTNGTSEDYQVVTSIAREKNIPFKFIDVSEEFSDSLGSIDYNKCKKYGEYAAVYSGNTKITSLFEQATEYDWVGFGYLGESMRPLGALDDSYHNDFSILDFVKKVYCRTGIEKLFELDGFYEFVSNEILDLPIRNNETLSIDDSFRIFSFSRFDADCYMNNFSNMFLHNFPIFGQKEIADKIDSIHYKWFSNEVFSLKMVDHFDKTLLEKTIFSHHREFSFDKRTFTMKKSYKYLFLDKMKKIFKDTFVYKNLYLKWLHVYIRPQSSKNEEIANECIKRIENIALLRNSSINVKFDGAWDGTDVGTLAQFVSELIILDKLGEKG